jgi:hypothetical protein
LDDRTLSDIHAAIEENRRAVMYFCKSKDEKLARQSLIIADLLLMVRKYRARLLQVGGVAVKKEVRTDQNTKLGEWGA